MKKSILVLLLLIPAFLFCQVKLVSTKINNDISLKIPTDFIIMASRDRINKFVSSKIPLIVYTSMDKEINFSVNTNIIQWSDGDEITLRNFYKASFEALFDEVEYIRDTIEDISGQTFIIFEFVSSLKDENVFVGRITIRNYTYIQYTSYEGQVLLFNFGCNASLMNQWQSVAEEIMQSVSIK